MTQYTTSTYKMKREIINFSNKLSEGLSRPERKFYTDMTYGMLASGSSLLTNIAQTLQEDILKINVVDRLSRHLAEGIPSRAMWNHMKTIRRWALSEPVIHIDDGDVIKPDGYVAKLHCQSPYLVPFVGPIHQEINGMAGRAKLLQKSPAFWRISAVPCRQRKYYPIPITCGGHMKFGIPSAQCFSDGLRAVFFKAPIPSGCTLIQVESRLTTFT